MIKLFSTPRATINLGLYDNLLHGSEVGRFEAQIAEYVGANYACSFNSASSAIFLALHMVVENWPHLFEKKTLLIPATIPPVVPNMVLNAIAPMRLVENTEWIGSHYILANYQTFKIIDSAQAIEEGIFEHEANPEDLMIFSFYPTKPIGGIDGGMIVSNDSDKIDYLRKMSLNGTGPAINSWERPIEYFGWKMYMNSVQAQVANQQLDALPGKIPELDMIRGRYEAAFERADVPRPQTNGQLQGYHLYRVYVFDNQHFIRKAHAAGICCGIHYRSLHQHPLYGKYAAGGGAFVRSTIEHLHTVSLPFHVELTDKNIEKIIDFVIEYQDRHGPPNCG